MVPAAAASLSHGKVWEDLFSTKNSALVDALRLEPGSMFVQNNSSSADAWISQASQRDMQSLTMALQRELCSKGNEFVTPPGWVGSEWRCKSESEVSSESGGKEREKVSGSSPWSAWGISRGGEVMDSVRRGKVSKRRSRAANKTPITFLNADPANFRAMVQQVTGVPVNPNATRIWSSSTDGVGMPGLVRPEPKRASSSAAAAVTATASAAIQGLPTLDTSAIFIAACGGASRNLNNAFSSANLSNALSSANLTNAFSSSPPLARNAAPSEDSFITEKLRAACMQSLVKNGGGSGGGAGNGFFMADQSQGLMNFTHEADLWFNNNADVELNGSVL